MSFFSRCEHNSAFSSSYLPALRHSVTSSHSQKKNPCPLCAGNAAVVKPSELSEFSSLLLRALLPRYLDQVWTPAAIVAECWGMKAFCQEWTIENRAACSTVMMLIRSV